MLSVIISILVFAAIFFTERTSQILHFTLIFMLFWGATVVLKVSEQLVNFYLFGLLFSMIMLRWLGRSYQTQSTSTDINGSEKGGIIRGWGHETISVGLAAGLWLVAKGLQGAAKGQILGVAPLAVESSATFQDKLQLAFAPSLSGTLGIIENYVFVGFLVALLYNPVLLTQLSAAIASFPLFSVPIFQPLKYLIAVSAELMAMALPYVIMPILFGVFHVAAYLNDWGMMLSAAGVMFCMAMTRKFQKGDMTPMNLFHYTWNAVITAAQRLSIIG